MNRSRSVVAALDIGGTKIAAALAHASAEGRVSSWRTGPTAISDTEAPAALLDATADLIRPLLHDHRVDLLGVASAGIVEPGHGLVTHATDALEGWAGTEVGP